METFKKSVGNELKRFRKIKGFKTQDDLAAALNVDQGRVAKWESGKTLPSPKYQEALAELLSLPEGIFDPVNHQRPSDMEEKFKSFEEELRRLKGVLSVSRVLTINDKLPSAEQLLLEREALKDELKKLRSNPLVVYAETLTPSQAQAVVEILQADLGEPQADKKRTQGHRK